MQTIESMNGDSTLKDLSEFTQVQIIPFLAAHTYSQCQLDVSLNLIKQHCQENDNCLPHYLVQNAATNAQQIAELFQAYQEDHQTTLKAYDAGAILSNIVFSQWPPSTPERKVSFE